MSSNSLIRATDGWTISTALIWYNPAMGAWSTSLSSNDIYADIYYEFFELYNDGHSVEDITNKIINENQEIIDSYEDGYNVWFALAKAQWETKQLDQHILEKVTSIIKSGDSIKVWRELGATEPDLEKRQVVLDKFLEQLRSERPKPKARRSKKSRTYEPGFDKGDCLTFKLNNGNYGGIIVLEAASTVDHPFNVLLVATTINQPVKPNLKDFMKTMILVGKTQDFSKDEKSDEFREVWHARPEICRSTSTGISIIEKVAKIKVDRTYDLEAHEWSAGSLEKAIIPRIDYLIGETESRRGKPMPLKPYLRDSIIGRMQKLLRNKR